MQGVANTEKFTKPQKQKRLKRLGDVVQALPQVKWKKTTAAIEMLHRLTGIKERSLWRHIESLRNADAALIDSLAEITSLSRHEIRKRISRIPAGK